jgi:hypothetical protein
MLKAKRQSFPAGRKASSIWKLSLLLLSSPSLADWIIQHDPISPTEGQPVAVTVQTEGPPFPDQLWLHYQLVDPGKYISQADEAFQTSWKTIPMADSGLGGDLSANDGILAARLPGSLQKHRRLVRYLVTRNKKLGKHVAEISEHHAYFVYDGLPDWYGAINPKSPVSSLSEKKRFPSSALSRVPVYHLISKQEWIEAATWRPSGHPSRSADANDYRYTGTLVYDGKVYDHVKFRARGGVWRHAMGKNMWKFNFRKEQPFQAYDQFDSPYLTAWDKLNLGACIQQGQYGLRGEHGMFDALTYRLFNLTGTPAPSTHWVHLRVIDNAEEASKDQYNGDFWGLYLAIENIDQAFLNEHNLATGNLYKIEHRRPLVRHIGVPFVHSPSEAYQFLNSLSRGSQNAHWWQQNIDLTKYYRYRSVVESVRHYDISEGKNYYYYFDGGQNRWITIPWDVDLTWGEHMYGSGKDPFYRAGVFHDEERKADFQTELTSFKDLLFNEDEMERLIDDYASIIDPSSDTHSLADADRAMWDYHPVMRSRYSSSRQAGQGRYYFGDESASFKVMVAYLKQFVQKRSRWVNQSLLKGSPILERPELRLEEAGGRFLLSATNVENRETNYQWRSAEIRDQAPGIRGKYEIEGSIIPNQNSLHYELPKKDPGTYRIRARTDDPNERPSRWSLPIEIVIGHAVSSD